MEVRKFFENIAKIESTEMRIDYICSTRSYLKIFEIKFCDECGKAFLEGYYDGGSFYCSDACLHGKYTSDEWKELTEYEDNEAYWSDWTEIDGAQELADAYNEILLPALRKAEEIKREEKMKEAEEPELYTFWTYDSLVAFCKKHAEDDRRAWYWGDIANFDDELYTLQELMDDAELSWFDGEEPAFVWDFGNR